MDSPTHGCAFLVSDTAESLGFNSDYLFWTYCGMSGLEEIGEDSVMVALT